MASTRRAKRQVQRFKRSSRAVSVRKERSCGWWCWGGWRTGPSPGLGMPSPEFLGLPPCSNTVTDRVWHSPMAFLPPNPQCGCCSRCLSWSSFSCIPVPTMNWKQMVSWVHGTMLQEITALFPRCPAEKSRSKQKNAVYAIAFSLAGKWLSAVKSWVVIYFSYTTAQPPVESLCKKTP